MSEAFAGVGRRIIIATHRRSGTHLTIDLLRKQFAECRSTKRLGEPIHHLYLTLELLNRQGFLGERARGRLTLNQAMRILRRSARPIVKTHGQPGFDDWQPPLSEFVAALLRDADVFYVVRDGRSVLASMHVYAQYFRPEARCSLSEFIRQESDGVNYVAAWARHVRAWAAQPDVHVIRFEDVVGDTRAVVARLGELLQLQPLFIEPLLPRRLRNIWQSRWHRLASTCPEPSTILSDGYNRRKKANWRDELSPDDRRFFHEHAGDVLIQFGYETSGDWVHAR